VNDVLQRMLTSVPERAEAALEARLTAVPAISRCATVAVASSEDGVGKTMCTFVAGTLLADRSRLRVLAIDADASRGTLPCCSPIGCAQTARLPIWSETWTPSSPRPS
jgi:Mrp family chromosome partitioning ATPase